MLCMLMGCTGPMVGAAAVAPMQAELCQLLGSTLLLLVGREGQQELEPVGVLAVQVVPAGRSSEDQAVPLLVSRQGPAAAQACRHPGRSSDTCSMHSAAHDVVAE